MARLPQPLKRKRMLKQLELAILMVIVVFMMYWTLYMMSVATIRGFK